MPQIFNIIAKLCSYIIDQNENDTLFVNFSCISESANEQIRQDVLRSIPVLFSSDNGARPEIRQLHKTDLDNKFFENLNEHIAALKKSSDYYGLIGLLQVLDEALETILKDKIKDFQSDDFSVVLNTNREITGIGLLPRCSCIWERKNRLSHSYNRLDSFLYNFLMVKNSVLGDLIDKHFFLPYGFFKGFDSHRSLKIAATPLRLERHYDLLLNEYDKVMYFGVNYPELFYSGDNELIWNKITEASEHGCDIIVFPELLGNPYTAEYVSSRLKALNEKEQAKIPSLIILPSVLSDKQNKAAIIDRTGKILCTQSKQNPFRYIIGNNGFLEEIVPNLVVNIFHYKEIGRIAVLICKDFITTKYMEQLMICFKLTLIIVPSFSTGSYDFRQSFDLCAHEDCNVVWINTCAAIEKGKEMNFENIGYVRKRIGRNDDEMQKLCKMPICRDALNGKCTHSCIYYETIRGV